MYAALIDLYGRCGELAEHSPSFANGRETTMVESSTHGNARLMVWNVILNALLHNGMAKKALDLFEQMVENGLVSPDGITFVALLNVCSHAGLTQQALGRAGPSAILLSLNLSRYLSFSTLSLNQIYKTMWKQHGSNQTCSMALVDGLGIAGRIEEPEGFVMPCTDIRCWPTFMPT